MGPFSSRKRKILEKRLAALYEELEAANEQLMSTLEETARLRIKRNIKNLEAEIKDVEQEIQPLVSSSDIVTALESEADADQAEGDDLVHSFIDKLKQQWLWVYYIAWLAACVGFLAVLSKAFDLPPCPLLLSFAFLACVGGIAILGFSFLGVHKSHYAGWDRLLTFGLLIVATGSIGLYALHNCVSTSGLEYQVRVEVAGTGEVIPNAKVTIESGCQVPKNEFTDSNGFARIPIAASCTGKPGRLIVEADRYETYTENIDLNERDLSDVIQLKPCQPTFPSPTITPQTTPAIVSTPWPTNTPLPTLSPSTPTLASCSTPHPKIDRSGPAGEVIITQPVGDCVAVGKRQAITVTWSEVSTGVPITMWVLVYSPVVRRYYPHECATVLQPSGSQRCSIYFVKPEPYEVVVVLADRDADAFLHRSGRQGEGILQADLPEGMAEKASLLVVCKE